MSKIQFSSEQSNFVVELVKAYRSRHWEQYEGMRFELDAGDTIWTRHPLRPGAYVEAIVMERTELSDDEKADIAAGRVPASIWCGDEDIEAAITDVDEDQFLEDGLVAPGGYALAVARIEEDVDEESLRHLVGNSVLPSGAKRHERAYEFGDAVIDLTSTPVRLCLTFRCVLSHIKYGLTSSKWMRDLQEAHQQNTCVESVAVVDDVLAPAQALELSKMIDLLRNDQAPDYHPGSEGRVRDIIHPSLYCFVAGKTRVRDTTDVSALSHLLEDRDPHVGCIIARNPHCPEHLLATLATHEDAAVRMAVAQNPSCPESVLATLASDMEDDIRTRAAQHPNASRWIVARARQPGGTRLEFDDGETVRFWEVALSGAEHVVRSGNRGEVGRARKRSFSDEAAAREHAWKLRRRKERDGYRTVREASLRLRLDFWGRNWSSSGLRWLPSEVDVSKKGAASFVSPINGVDRERHAGLHASLEALLTATLPAFQAVMGGLRNRGYGKLSASGEIPDFNDPQARSEPLPVRKLAGRRLQIVVKIVDYELRGGIVHEGAWHVEGISDEGIVATAVHVLECDDAIRGGHLMFSRQALFEEGDYACFKIPQDPAGPLYDFASSHTQIPLGTVATRTNRTVVFPNSHIHRLDQLVSDTPSPARRRVVVFWLIDPDRRILSTADVEPPQQHMTREQALAYRLELMKERTGLEQHYNDDWHDINLCEH